MNSPPEVLADDDRGHKTARKISISPLSVLNIALRHRKLLIMSAAIGLAGGVVYALLQPRTYEGVVRFVTAPGSTRMVAGVGGDLGPIQQRDPFDYYASVLTSTQVLDAVLATKLGDESTVRSHLGLPPDADPQAARTALSASAVRLDASTRSRTAGSFPVLMIKASWSDPQMAADLANAFFKALQAYDQDIRSASAKERATFIGTQIDLTATRLKTAEDDLREFRQRNRLLMRADTGSGRGAIPVPPELELRRDQLQREVTVQSELYLTLKKAFDQARIAELDEASGLVVIEEASPPVTPTGLARRRLAAGGCLIGFALGCVLVLVVEVRRRTDMNSPDAYEFAGHVADIRQDFTGIRARAAQALSPPPARPPVTDQSSVKRDA
jgi:uncharacterized protein involved in exopolysaccharide biosynthesis